MSIYLNARYFSQNMSGVQRYSHEMFSAMDRLMAQDVQLRRRLGTVVALSPKTASFEPRWSHIDWQATGRNEGHIWEQTTLYRASKSGILVSLGNSGPLRHSDQILALHDANIWEIPAAFSPRYRILHRRFRPVLAKRARQLITVSRYSARVLARHLGVEEARFSIIPNGADHILRLPPNPGGVSSYGLESKGYLLCVGNQSPNKNVHALLSAHSQAGDAVAPLVVVGGQARGVEGAQLYPNPRVRYLGRVSDAQLVSLYANALGFVFPSLYEGFGIPPLEAMGLGTPVLAAQTTALPEVLGNAALWFDPRNVENMKDVLVRFCKMSPVQHRQLRMRGKLISDQYKWENSARLLIRKLLEQRGDMRDFA